MAGWARHCCISSEHNIVDPVSPNTMLVSSRIFFSCATTITLADVLTSPTSSIDHMNNMKSVISL